MKFLGILFVFFGYVLVYASAAAGGKFATEPWAGLFADAYTGAPTSTAQQLENIAGAAQFTTTADRRVRGVNTRTAAGMGAPSDAQINTPGGRKIGIGA